MALAAAGMVLLAGCGGDKKETTAKATSAAGASSAAGTSTSDSATAAGSSAAQSSAAAPAEMRKVTIGALPIVPSAGLQLAVDKGFFKSRGLDVKLELGQGGAALLPAVVAGQMDFVVGQPLPLMIAQGRGLDVRIVSGYAASKPSGKDINGVVASAKSGITSAKQLEGKKVAVNTLNAAGDLTIREAVRMDGGDGSKVQFVEMPFPDMPAALGKGQIDAGWVPEPFLSILTGAGNQLVTYNYQATIPGLDTLVTFTSGKTVKDKADLVTAMRAAMTEATTYAEAHPDEVRKTLETFLKMKPELAANVGLETFTAKVNQDGLKALGDLAVKDKVLKAPADLTKLLAVS
jgi:NitT/TauT family transport system substrate-binding protein